MLVLERWFWAYLFARPAERDSKWPLVDLWRSIHCRLGGHAAGVVWYNPSGFEPDYSCKTCGDFLG